MRGMLVVARASSRTTMRPGSSVACSFARLYDILALLLLGLEIFFERQAQPGHNLPKDRVAGTDLALLR